MEGRRHSRCLLAFRFDYASVFAPTYDASGCFDSTGRSLLCCAKQFATVRNCHVAITSNLLLLSLPQTACHAVANWLERYIEASGNAQPSLMQVAKSLLKGAQCRAVAKSAAVDGREAVRASLLVKQDERGGAVRPHRTFCLRYEAFHGARSRHNQRPWRSSRRGVAAQKALCGRTGRPRDCLGESSAARAST